MGCMVYMGKNRDHFREMGGFWAFKPEQYRTQRPGKLMPDWLLGQVCRTDPSKATPASGVPAYHVPKPTNPGDRTRLEFARDEAKQVVRDRMGKSWNEMMGRRRRR